MFLAEIPTNRDRYRLTNVLGRGGFGVVFKAISALNEKEVAIKIQCRKTAAVEVDVLQSTAQCVHFPRLIDSGELVDGDFVVMQLLGSDLNTIRITLPNRVFTLSSAIRSSMQLQCLHAIEELHSVGFLSQDVKPSNFLVGCPGPQQRTIFMIDFGISRRFRSKKGSIIGDTSLGWKGTSKYCSLQLHLGEDQSKRDDIESWFYMTVEFLTGRLPWSHCARPDRAIVADLKRQVRTSLRKSFLGRCPKQFNEIFEVVDSWDVKTEPDYDGLLVYLYRILRHDYIEFDDPYDWENLPQFQLKSSTLPMSAYSQMDTAGL
ncbi:hypothetical protein AB6A40_000703 [Gnathostoma spinigerum]|uniref:Protein kinase domain-containing protein n=1 Tax=Gnathostoma spinigerum TaxID=75299 RepID=A0ABD6E2L1_9BILA